MKPETERLLHQCRSALVQQSNEQLHALFVSWFERLVGEESIEETLNDLCLLLGYGIRSVQSQILYATSTAWWEVEGCADLDGEFECVEVAACSIASSRCLSSSLPCSPTWPITSARWRPRWRGSPALQPDRSGCVPWPPGLAPVRGNLFTIRAGAMSRIPLHPPPKPNSPASSSEPNSASSSRSWSNRRGSVATCCWARGRHASSILARAGAERIVAPISACSRKASNLPASGSMPAPFAGRSREKGNSSPVRPFHFHAD